MCGIWMDVYVHKRMHIHNTYTYRYTWTHGCACKTHVVPLVPHPRDNSAVMIGIFSISFCRNFKL